MDRSNPFRSPVMPMYIRNVPAWWVTAICCTVEVYARLPVSWEVAREIGYALTADMVGRGPS